MGGQVFSSTFVFPMYNFVSRKVKKAYLTHISHNLGLHKETSKKLPKNVKIAYDSLKISI